MPLLEEKDRYTSLVVRSKLTAPSLISFYIFLGLLLILYFYAFYRCDAQQVYVPV